MSGDTGVEEAREAALRALRAKARSRSELTVILERQGHAAEAIEDALDRLERVGLVDDAALARDVVERASRERAGSALLVALQRRGIDRELAAAALVDAPERPEAVEAILARRWSSLRTLPEHVAARRAQGLLARRGFDPGGAAAIIDRLRSNDS